MRIEVPVIESADELEKVQPFFVEHLLWGDKANTGDVWISWICAV